MHTGKEIEVVPFDSTTNPLTNIESSQSRYLKSYLQGLSVQTVIIEHNYFDRDYLDEFAVFYSKSARGYANICKRIHFFNSAFEKENLLAALSDDVEATKQLKSCYLGFSVLRPIALSPFAKTVLRWYPQLSNQELRVIKPSRPYTCNIAGLKLSVTGLAWQQQDTGVSACATIGIWTMLQSSAFDDHHSIPTTAEITQAAHEHASLGDRVFPSQGLKPHQILEAIKAQNLTPITSIGDVSRRGATPFFSTKKFASTCAAFVRSGYPVLVIGRYTHCPVTSGHMVCVVGFRESTNYDIQPGDYRPLDENANIFYIHDDNIGPSVRCKLVTENIEGSDVAIIETAPPEYVDEAVRQPIEKFKFLPELLIIAVHEELRISSENFYAVANSKAAKISHLINAPYIESKNVPLKIVFSSQFLTIREYMAEELPRLCAEHKEILSRIRIDLTEKVPPISLHIGLIRIAIINDDIDLVVDVLCDTTDSDRNQPIFAHIVFDEALTKLLAKIAPEDVLSELGTQIIAHD